MTDHDPTRVQLEHAAEEAAGYLLMVYELGRDTLSAAEQAAISTTRQVCNEIVDGDR